MLTPLIEVEDQTFGKVVLEAPIPVLADFRASWCAPCRALEPALSGIATERAGALLVCQLDVDRWVAPAARAFNTNPCPTQPRLDVQSVLKSASCRTPSSQEVFHAATG